MSHTDPNTSAEPTLRELMTRVGSRWRLLTVVAGSVFAAVAIWTFTATPRYRSTALLRIESRQSGSSAMLDQLTSLPTAGLVGGLGKDELETEIGVLHSRRVTDAALDSFALTVRVREPVNGRRWLRLRLADASDVSGRLVLQRSADGTYRVEATKLSAAGPLPAALAAGDSLRIGGVIIGLTSNAATDGPPRFTLDLLPRYKARTRLEKRVDIKRQESGSRLVQITFDDEDRELAAAVVTRMVSTYMSDVLQNDRHDAASQVSELRRELDEQKVRLSDAEERLRAFQKESRIIIPEEQGTAQIKRIAALSGQIDILTIERRALERMLALVEPRSRGGRDPSAYRQLATFPSLIANRGIQDLLVSLMELENKRSELSVRRTGDNDELQQLTTRITDIEQQLGRIGNQYLEGLDQQLSTSTQQIKTLTDTLQVLPDQQMQFVRLVRDRTIANETYIAIYKQLKQSEVQDAIRLQKVRIIDAPTVANVDDPEFPKPVVQLALGLLLGLSAALALALTIELWREPSPGNGS